MTVFTVKSVGPEPREWQSGHGGTLLSYKVDLAEPDGKVAKGVEWNKKPESPAPQVYEEVVGHLEEGKFGPRFKIDYEATKELSQGQRPSSGSSAPSGGSRGGRDLDRSIARQVALKVMAESINSEGGLTPELRNHVEEIEGFILEAGQAANQGAGAASSSAPQGNSQGTSPATAPAPGSQSAPSEAVHDVEMALAEPPSGQFLSAQARTIVANYMLSQLPPEELLRACNQLTNSGDQSQQDMTLRAMKLRAERWTGKPLPESAPVAEEEIPF